MIQLKSSTADGFSKEASRLIHIMQHDVAKPTAKICELIVTNIIAAAVAEAEAVWKDTENAPIGTNEKDGWPSAYRFAQTLDKILLMFPELDGNYQRLPELVAALKREYDEWKDKSGWAKVSELRARVLELENDNAWIITLREECDSLRNDNQRLRDKLASIAIKATVPQLERQQLLAAWGIKPPAPP